MRVRTGFALAATAIVCAACEPTPYAELLSIDFAGGSVFVDTVCADGGCTEVPTVTGTLVFTNDGTITDPEAAVGVAQYRVDYGAIGGAEMPYFADRGALDNGDTEDDTDDDEYEPLVTVALGETAEFTIQAAGNAQRAWVAQNFGDAVIVVDAIVTIEGYDQNNTKFNVEAGEFSVLFTNGSD